MTAGPTRTLPDLVPESHGGFSLGGLQLALPMSALREVMPCTALTELPCAAACVIGGIALREVVVPVVDLRIALGRAAPDTEARNVVLMVHAGGILGLLADGVTGIFEVPRPAHVDASGEPADAIFLGGAIRPDSGAAVSLLSPAAIAGLPGVPRVADPEPGRQRVVVDTSTDANAQALVDASVPMMLMRCGNVPLAVEAMLVHATLSDPAVEASALTAGHCLGAIAYGAVRLPAIDLLSLCGLGRLDVEAGTQAFIVSLPAGQVAFLISAVVDVVRTAPDDVKPVPAFALPQPQLIAGALPLSALPVDVVERTLGGAGQYLVLSTAGLTGCEAVVALSGMNTTGTVGAATASAASATKAAITGRGAAERRAMITYRLATERASPLEQVTEILNYQPGGEMFARGGPLLGLMVDRGRSIPVVCLGRAVGEACDPPTSASSVLVVESQGELIGFAVTALGTIDQAEWEPSVPDFNATAAVDGEPRSSHSHPLALLGTGEAERMLNVIDLHRLARQLQSQALAA